MTDWKHKITIAAARNLRRRSTAAEQVLWDRLRNRQVSGAKFRWQVRIGETPFVVDFCCCEAHLIIELDGEIHQYQQDADRDRQQRIEALGYRFLRFSNQAVLENMDGVIKTIMAELPSPPAPLF
jgi:very-short-patch-repair endonuclease